MTDLADLVTILAWLPDAIGNAFAIVFWIIIVLIGVVALVFTLAAKLLQSIGRGFRAVVRVGVSPPIAPLAITASVVLLVYLTVPWLAFGQG